MREDEVGLNEGDTRDLSPDARTVIRRSMGYLPGDIHQISPVYCASIFDAKSREVILALGRYRECDSSHECKPDSSALICIGPVRLRVSVAEGNWSMDRDGWHAHPLDCDIAAARALLDPHFPVSRHGLMTNRVGPLPIKRTRQRLKDATLMAAFCLKTAGTSYLYMTADS